MDYIATITDHPIAAASAAIAIVLIIRKLKIALAVFAGTFALIIFLVFRRFSLAGIIFVVGAICWLGYGVSSETGTANAFLWDCSKMHNHADCMDASQHLPVFLATMITSLAERIKNGPDTPTGAADYSAPRMRGYPDPNPLRNANIDCRLLAGYCR